MNSKFTLCPPESSEDKDVLGKHLYHASHLSLLCLHRRPLEMRTWSWQDETVIRMVRNVFSDVPLHFTNRYLQGKSFLSMPLISSILNRTLNREFLEK
jgi:hypothetical protein